MSAPEKTDTRARLLTIQFWSGIALAPLAALLLLLGGATAAAILAIIAVVILGLAVIMRRDDGSARLDLEETMLDEIDMLRDDVRADITTAARATHKALAERVAALQESLAMMQRQVEAARASGGDGRGAPAGPAPHRGPAAAPGVLRRTETVHVTTHHTIVDPYGSGTTYDARSRGPERGGDGYPRAGRPPVGQGWDDRDDDQGRHPADDYDDRPRAGRPDHGAAARRDGGDRSARDAGRNGTPRGGAPRGYDGPDGRARDAGPSRELESGRDSRSGSGRDAARSRPTRDDDPGYDGRERSARDPGPGRDGSGGSTRDGGAGRVEWVDRSERGGRAGGQWPDRAVEARGSRDADGSRSLPAGRDRDLPGAGEPGRALAGRRPSDARDEWTEARLREYVARRDPYTDSGELAPSRPAADDPGDDGRWAAMRAGDRWAEVRDDGHGRELRMGERRTERRVDETGTQLRIVDRWSSVREEPAHPGSDSSWRGSLPAGIGAGESLWTTGETRADRRRREQAEDQVALPPARRPWAADPDDVEMPAGRSPALPLPRRSQDDRVAPRDDYPAAREARDDRPIHRPQARPAQDNRVSPRDDRRDAAEGRPRTPRPDDRPDNRSDLRDDRRTPWSDPRNERRDPREQPRDDRADDRWVREPGARATTRPRPLGFDDTDERWR